jgi:hypothetical protein
MKKLTVLFAAAAMFAFVGCNKENASTYVADENGNVTLMMSGENWQNTNKQTYMDQFNRIAFDILDEALINGATASVIPCDANASTTDASENTIQRSFYGMMTVNASVLTGNDYVIYPAGLFTAGTAADMSDYTVTMPAIANFIMANDNTTLGEGHPVWPMGSKLSGHQFLMKNAVAVMTPSIKYGAPFINALATMADSPIATENVDVISGYNFPQLYITAIDFVSTDQMMTGIGHLENMDTDPTLVMEGTVPADGDVLSVNIDPENPIEVPLTGNSESLLGNITVAPFPAGKHIQMNVSFLLYFPETGEIYNFIYTGNNVELTDQPNSSILRSKRTTMCANLYQAAAINQISLVD